MRGTPPVDPEALLVALVLAPATFSRNRFFALYLDAEARRVRRRATLLRSLARQLVAGVERAELTPAEHGGVQLTYEVPSLGLKRTASLDALELAVVRFAIARGVRGLPQELGACADIVSRAPLPPALLPDPADAPRIERALAQLLPDGSWDAAVAVAAEGEQDALDAAVTSFPLRDVAQPDTQAP